MIVVGLGYAGENLDYNRLRRDDLLPVVENGQGGQAAGFLGMIETAANFERAFVASGHTTNARV